MGDGSQRAPHPNSVDSSGTVDSPSSVSSGKKGFFGRVARTLGNVLRKVNPKSKGSYNVSESTDKRLSERKTAQYNSSQRSRVSSNGPESINNSPVASDSSNGITADSIFADFDIHNTADLSVSELSHESKVPLASGDEKEEAVYENVTNANDLVGRSIDSRKSSMASNASTVYESYDGSDWSDEIVLTPNTLNV